MSITKTQLTMRRNRALFYVVPFVLAAVVVLHERPTARQKVGIVLALIAATLLAPLASALAELKLPAIIGDHMVLQQKQANPIWGWDAPGTEVTITFGDQKLVYRKRSWKLPDPDGTLVEKGLRYGENPGQEAALYRMVNGNLVLGETETIQPGQYLASDIELLQSGKHPGKTNLTDADNSLNILRYFTDRPTAVIVVVMPMLAVNRMLAITRSITRKGTNRMKPI